MDGVVAGAGDEHATIGRDDHVVRAEVNVEVAETSVFLCVDDTDAAAAPIADVKVDLIGAHHAGVRILANGNAGFEFETFWIEDEDFVGGFVANVDFAGGRMHGETGEEGLFERDDRFVGIDIGGGAFVFVVVEDVQFAAAAAGNVDLPAVFAEGETVEGGLERIELGDATGGGVENCQAGIVETAADGEEAFAVGRDDHLERHVAHHRHGLARRSDAPTVEQEVFVRCEVLGLAYFGRVYRVRGGPSRSWGWISGEGALR